MIQQAVHELVDIDEDDEVIIEVRDGTDLKPVKRKVNAEELRKLLQKQC